MLVWLRAAAVLPLALVGRMRRIERALVRHLRAENARSAGRAVTLEPGRPGSGWVRRRLERAGALVPTPDGRYYLSEVAYVVFVRQRRRRGFAIFALLLVTVAGLYFWGDIS